MSACISFQDLVEINQPQVAALERIGSSFADERAPEACQAFTRQVQQVEGVLRNTYGVAASLAKKAETLEEVARIWTQMSELCSQTLRSLKGLKDKYPHCGTPALCDLALDYKLASDKRHRQVMEEIACRKMEFPKGLFPEQK
jgi:hypothetical protein